MAIYTLIQKPAKEPVSLELLKDFLKIDPGEQDHDRSLQGAIQTARAMVEQYTSRALIAQKWQLKFERPVRQKQPHWWYENKGLSCIGAPQVLLKLPFCPFMSIEKVASKGNRRGERIFDATHYEIKEFAGTHALALRSDCAFIQDETLVVDAIFGYGHDADDVPMLIRQCILRLAGYLFDYRGVNPGHKATAEILAMVSGYKVIKL